MSSDTVVNAADKSRTDAVRYARQALDRKAIELVVGWRHEGGYDVGSIEVDGQLRDDLITAAGSTLERISGAAPRRFDLDTTLEPGEVLVAPAELFPDDDKLLAALQSDPIPNQLKPKDLSGAAHGAEADGNAIKIVVYAIRCRVASKDPWAVFLNKADPWISARSTLALFGESGLRKTEEPIFQFRPSFDLLIAGRTVITAGYTTFDQLFRQVAVGRAGAAVADLVKRLPKSLPLAKSAVTVLKTAAERSPRVRNRLRVVLQKRYLDELTPKKVKDELARQKVGESLFLKAGELIVDPKRPLLMLSLLDEDLYRGGFSGELWITERKSTETEGG